MGGEAHLADSFVHPPAAATTATPLNTLQSIATSEVASEVASRGRTKAIDNSSLLKQLHGLELLLLLKGQGQPATDIRIPLEMLGHLVRLQLMWLRLLSGRLSSPLMVVRRPGLGGSVADANSGGLLSHFLHRCDDVHPSQQLLQQCLT